MKRARLLSVLMVPFDAASLAGCGVNSIPTAEENVKARWADVHHQDGQQASAVHVRPLALFRER